MGFSGSPKGEYARAEFYSRQADRSYRPVQSVTLLNPVAPADFFVSDGGELATIDNWHNAGHGSVIAVYNGQGQVVRSYKLAHLFSAEEIRAFGQSVSSIPWHQGPVYINKDQRTLYLMIASGRDVVVGLQTGEIAVCETRSGKYLCRNDNPGRRWLPYVKVVPERCDWSGDRTQS